MKKVALIISFLSALTCLRSQDLILNFDHNRSQPIDASIRHLENNLQYLKQCDSLLLVGHTDTTGSQAFNETLSKSRVDWINGYLIKKGVKARTLLDWKGESEVLNSGNDSLNRRVMLYAYYAVRDFPKKQAEIFQIDNSRDTMIVGKENTVIILPASSLLSDYPDGSGKFDVYLTEYYSLEDILLNNLSTQTHTDMLVTEGMINLKVYQDGVKCRVNPDNPISIGIPVVENSNEDLELFYGGPDENGNVIWEDNASRGGVPIYFGELFSEPVEDVLEPDFMAATFLGGGDENLIRYIKERIDYSQIEVDSSSLPDIKVVLWIDPLGNICKPEISPDTMLVITSQIRTILADAPRCEPVKSGKQRYGSSAIVSLIFDQENNINTTARRAERNARSSAAFRDSIINSLEYKVFSSINLSYINCDFYAFRGKERINFIIETEGVGKIISYLVYKEYKAVMSYYICGRDAENDKSYLKYPSTPLNEEVYAMLIKNIGDKIFVARKQVNTSEIQCVVDDFKEISEENLKEELSKLSEAF